MQAKCLHLIVCVFFLSTSAFSELISVSAGSWIVLSSENKQSYFNKVAPEVYLGVKKLNIAFGLPLALTIINSKEAISHSFAPGDLHFYIGKSLFNLEPRIGMALPMYYDTDDEWIGSYNVKLRYGLGFRSNSNPYEALGFNGELMASTCLDNRDALLKSPSTDMYLSMKKSIELSKKTKIGAELLLTGKYSIWKKWRTARNYNLHVEEIGAALIPNLFAEYFINKSYYAGFKAGIGPSMGITNELRPLAKAQTSWKTAINSSLSISSYF